MTKDAATLLQEYKKRGLTTYEVIQEISKTLFCKVGDIIYELDNDEIYTLKVTDINITESDIDIYANGYDDEYEEEYDDEHIFSINDFNVNVFTDKELAIKSLNTDEESDD